LGTKRNGAVKEEGGPFISIGGELVKRDLENLTIYILENFKYCFYLDYWLKDMYFFKNR
jgi:hypothetical protein